MKMKYKRWTKKEEKFISENFGKMDLKDISKKLQRTEISINQKVMMMRIYGADIKQSRGYREWTADEERKLLELWEIETALDIAKILDRNRGAIYAKVKQLKNRDGSIPMKRKSEIEREKFENEAYEKLINQKINAGVYKKDIKVKLGQPYQIERVVKSVRDWNKFTGKCIAETKDHITIKNKVRAETFLKVDFLINEYRIKEIA